MLNAPEIPKDAFTDIINLLTDCAWTAGFHEEIRCLWNLCDNREQQLLLKDLIYRMSVLDRDKLRDACRDINAKIQQWKLTAKSSLIVAVANPKEADGSTAALQKIKNKIVPADDWHSRCIGTVPGAVEIVKDGDSIILFDDFIGSGEKMVKKYKWFKKSLEKVRKDEVDFDSLTFYFMAFSGMKSGIKHINDELGLPVFCSISLDKGITDNYPANEVPHKLEVMKSIEEKLALQYKRKKLEKYSCGYNKSETLYIWEDDNCPNNVFPVFWWTPLRNGEQNETLFTRAG